jgi:hypothetical protein
MQLIKNLAAAFVALIILILMCTCGRRTDYRPRRRWGFARRARH